MKIGIDARLWNESGVGRYTRNLVQNLQVLDKKNNYVLFAQSRDIDQIKFQISNFKFQIIPTDVRWHTISEQLQFPSTLEKENLDLMHFTYFSVPIFYNKPFVITIHDLILHHFSTGRASTLSLPLYKLKHFGYKFVISNAAKKAKKIIAVSQATRQEIVDHLEIDKEKITVIYEGIDSKILKNKNPSQRLVGLWPKKYFLYVGNAYPHKNLDFLINSFNTFSFEHQDVPLVLVGRDDYFYKSLRKKIDLSKLNKNIVFYGEASDDELYNLYKNASALMAPSLMEGFGLPIVEAMSQNCLVLASDIPVHREITRNCAIFFNPKDKNDLIEKLKDALDLKKQDDYILLKKKAKIRSLDFSWKKMAALTLTIYESCTTPGLA